MLNETFSVIFKHCVFCTRHGKLVAGYPWIYILACIILTCSCSLGLLRFRWENNIVRLWNPTNSETGRNFAWLWKNHPPDLRRHTLILYAEDVLQPQVIQRMYKIRQKLYTAVSKENVTWSQACLKVPLIPSKYSDFMEDVEEDSDEDDDPFAAFDDFGQDFQFTKTDFSVDFYPEPYCQKYNSLEDICFEDSLIELFALHGQVNETLIMNLTKDQILNALNAKSTKSGIFSVKKDFTEFLGRIQYDSEGKIQGAKALKMNLYGKMNVSEAHLERVKKDSVFGDQIALEQIDEVTRSIEDEFIGILEAERTKLETDEDTEHLDFIVAKSFPDAVNERITGDIPKVLGSFALMFFYVGVALSKCRLDCVDNKALLSRAGLAAVLMALITSYGLCTLMGFFISPLHNFIPFLMLGLGVDDMFVIVQAFDQLEPLKDKSEIPDKLAKTLANAGVAITVTSLTDLLAFAVGASTTVPALNSFCIYCGVGILIVYLYQITFFSAWLVIDQRRILDQRNACLPCIKSNCNTSGSTDKSCFPTLDLVGKYADMLAFKPIKFMVILVTIGILVASIYGNYMLEEDFDPWLFLSPKSYVARFKATHDYYFPDKGENVILFFNGDVTQENLLSMDRLLSSLTSEAEDHIIRNVDSWYTEFVKYFTQNLGNSQGLFSANVSLGEIHSALAQFLFSPAGGRYQYLFTFEEPLTCGRTLPTVYLNMMELAHFHFNSSNEGIEAMNSVKHLMRTSGFNGRSFPFSPMYSVWEIDEVIFLVYFKMHFQLILFNCR